MGKNKLSKFAAMERMDCVLQYPWGALQQGGFPWRGRWHERFGNANPIVLELGCGKGEYTVGLARQYPDRNFIGIDIKGARMYTGARQATDEGLPNAQFLRTDIELLPHFFAPGEVAEIWITFPDPQMKKVRKRLMSSRFLELYRQVCVAGAPVHLKTDSPFLHTFARMLASHNALRVGADTADLYGSSAATELPAGIMGIRTFYEQQWLARGLAIRYLRVSLPGPDVPALTDPDDTDIPRDTYRSFSRRTL